MTAGVTRSCWRRSAMRRPNIRARPTPPDQRNGSPADRGRGVRRPSLPGGSRPGAPVRGLPSGGSRPGACAALDGLRREELVTLDVTQVSPRARAVAGTDALRAYKVSAYDHLNSALRGDLTLDYEEEELIAQLDRAVSRFRLSEPVIVWRASDVMSCSARRRAISSPTMATRRRRCYGSWPRTSSSTLPMTCACWPRS
jgi:hypothetical protein